MQLVGYLIVVLDEIWTLTNQESMWYLLSDLLLWVETFGRS